MRARDTDPLDAIFTDDDAPDTEIEVAALDEGDGAATSPRWHSGEAGAGEAKDTMPFARDAVREPGEPVAPPVRIFETATRDRSEIGRRYSRYALRRRVAAGSMGLIYDATHLFLDRRVAIKFLQPRLLSDEQAVFRFLEEARSMARVCHPGIPAVHDFGQDSTGNAFLVMEYLEGESLATRLAREPLPLPDALEIAAQIAEALAAAHEVGLVHRDLKPENVFLTGEHPVRIKLIDFGVAKADDAPGRGYRTATGCLVGTPAYMAPEQTYSMAVTGRTDIYALGCVLFELIAGRPPFGGTVAELIESHRNREAPSLAACRGVPGPLAALVRTMLAKSPERRPAEAAELATQLRALAGTAVDPLAATARWPEAPPRRGPPLPAPAERAEDGPPSPEWTPLPFAPPPAFGSADRAARAAGPPAGSHTTLVVAGEPPARALRLLLVLALAAAIGLLLGASKLGL